MGLGEDLQQVAAAAREQAGAEEQLAAVIPTEPVAGERVFLCAFAQPDEGSRAWLALDASGRVIVERRLVREAVAIAALCEFLEEAVATGPEDLDDRAVRVATPAYLEELGAERGERDGLAEALRSATATVEELEAEVEAGYKLPLR